MQGWIPEDIIALSRIAGACPVRREIDVPCYHGNLPARENGCCSLPPLTTASSSPTHTEKKHGLCLIFSYEFSFFFSLCVVFLTIYHSQSSSEESFLWGWPVLRKSETAQKLAICNKWAQRFSICVFVLCLASSHFILRRRRTFVLKSDLWSSSAVWI